jgi:hypothetical protein
MAPAMGPEKMAEKSATRTPVSGPVPRLAQRYLLLHCYSPQCSFAEFIKSRTCVDDEEVVFSIEKKRLM